MSANMLAVSVGVTERQAQRILAKLKAQLMNPPSPHKSTPESLLHL